MTGILRTKERGTIEWLREVVTTLAAPADEQLQCLRDAGIQGSVQELVLEFKDTLPYVTRLVEEGVLSVDTTLAFVYLDRRFMSIGSAGSKLWTEKSLREDDNWAAVRALAHGALQWLDHPFGVIPESTIQEILTGLASSIARDREVAADTITDFDSALTIKQVNTLTLALVQVALDEKDLKDLDAIESELHALDFLASLYEPDREALRPILDIQLPADAVEREYLEFLSDYINGK